MKGLGPRSGRKESRGGGGGKWRETGRGGRAQTDRLIPRDYSAERDTSTPGPCSPPPPPFFHTRLVLRAPSPGGTRSTGGRLSRRKEERRFESNVPTPNVERKHEATVFTVNTRMVFSPNPGAVFQG